jgi:RNA polymerase sigma factor (sigma-70 family)
MIEDTYYLAAIRDGNRQRYYVAIPRFGDSERLVEIDEIIFWLLRSFQREDWRQERQARRHLERLALSDEELSERCGAYAPSPEDLLYRRILTDDLRGALMKLPSNQARRFLLHHGLDLTIRQIADSEGCGERRIRSSVLRAKKSLRKLLAEEGHNWRYLSN